MAIIGVSGYSGSGKDTVGKIIQYIMGGKEDPFSFSIEDAIAKPEEYDWVLEDSSKWKIKKFADKLKDIAEHITGIPAEKFEDQDFKKTSLPAVWWTTCDEGLQPMTVREFLQKLGTDAMRNGLHPNVWVNALMSDYKSETDIDTFRYAKGYTEERTPSQEEKKFEIRQLFEYLTEVKKPDWIITDVRFVNEAEAIKDKNGIIIRIDRPGYKPINTHPSETSLDSWNFDYKIANVSDLISLKFTVENILKHAKIL
jgi:hypothetical protein